MATSYFTATAETVRTDDGPVLTADFDAGDATVGPWSPEAMHGGPPAALIARQVRRAGSDPRFRLPSDGLIARATVEILTPVPVAPVTVEVRTIKPGRQAALVEASLVTRGSQRPAMIARCWMIRREQVPVPRTPDEPAPSTGSGRVGSPGHWAGGYLDSIEWVWVDGAFETPGPATVWARPLIPLVGGEQMTGAERILLVADSGNGIAAVASPRELIYLNSELTVHLHREPLDGRVWMSARTSLSPTGTGLVRSTLGDEDGSCGSGAQALFVSLPPAAATAP